MVVNSAVLSVMSLISSFLICCKGLLLADFSPVGRVFSEQIIESSSYSSVISSIIVFSIIVSSIVSSIPPVSGVFVLMVNASASLAFASCLMGNIIRSVLELLD